MTDLPLPARALRIFVVENHPDTLKYLTMYLEQMGHIVISATTMQGALTSLPGANCEVLISDIGLPDGDGWELMRRLRRPHPPYSIAMSGFGMNADQARSKAAGYREHLLKPINPEQLDALLEEAARAVVA